MAERAPTAGKKTHIAALKILAMLLVLFNHTGPDGFRRFVDVPDSPFFPIFLFLSVACKIAVPLFFMCSGALLLGRDEPFKKLFSHRILRYVIVLVLFSFAEYLFILRSDFSKFDLGYFFLRIYASDMHGAYWFLYAYLACLILLPFLRKMARALDGREFVYLIALQVVFTGVIPVVEFLAGRGAYHLNPDLNLPLLAQNVFFMLVGYWAENVLDMSRLGRRGMTAIALAGAGAIVLTCVLTVYKAAIDGRYDAELSTVFHASFVAVPTISTYILLKYAFARVPLRESVSRAILYMGELTFGIYLTHMFAMRVIRYVKILLDPYLGTFTLALLVVFMTAILSGAAIALIKRIPLVSKLL